MKKEDLELLPEGSVVAFLTPDGEPLHLETTKLKDGRWSCSFCPENHTSEEVAAFKTEMRVKRVGPSEAEKAPTITELLTSLAASLERIANALEKK